MKQSGIDPTLSINEIIRRHPAAIRVLNEFGVDSCCVGLACTAVGFMIIPGSVVRITLLAAGGSLSAFGAYAFIYNIWRTIDRRAPATTRPQPAVPSVRRLPVSESAS